MSITVALISILLSILGSVFVPNGVLDNLLGFLTTLGDAVLWVSLLLSLV